MRPSFAGPTMLRKISGRSEDSGKSGYRLESHYSADYLVTQWLEKRLAIKLPSFDLNIILKDGTILCKLANTLRTGCIPNFHEHPTNQAMQLENISLFLGVLQPIFKLPSESLFSPEDLNNGTDINSVLSVLLRLRDLRTN